MVCQGPVRRRTMKILFACIVIFAVVSALNDLGFSQEAKTEQATTLEKLLADYLQGKFAQAEATLRSLREGGNSTLPQILAQQDVIDKWQLYLRLLTEAKLTVGHPILAELRKDHSVPDLPDSFEGKSSEFVTKVIQEYLQSRIQRAVQTREIALALYKVGRTTESDYIAAKMKLEDLQLLLEIERLRSSCPKE
jgi:hypothetical protein